MRSPSCVTNAITSYFHSPNYIINNDFGREIRVWKTIVLLNRVILRVHVKGWSVPAGTPQVKYPPDPEYQKCLKQKAQGFHGLQL